MPYLDIVARVRKFRGADFLSGSASTDDRRGLATTAGSTARRMGEALLGSTACADGV